MLYCQCNPLKTPARGQDTGNSPPHFKYWKLTSSLTCARSGVKIGNCIENRILPKRTRSQEPPNQGGGNHKAVRNHHASLQGRPGRSDWTMDRTHLQAHAVSPAMAGHQCREPLPHTSDSIHMRLGKLDEPIDLGRELAQLIILLDALSHR